MHVFTCLAERWNLMYVPLAMRLHHLAIQFEPVLENDQTNDVNAGVETVSGEDLPHPLE